MGWLSAFLVNPALAAGGLVVASPILIHLFSRRRFRRVAWAAMDFLLEANRQNRRRVRMEQLILLALRCLAMFLLALMIMRPFVRSGALGAWAGGAARTERIFLLDDSFSMQYRSESGRKVFAEALSTLRALARQAGEENPADSMTIVLTSRPRSPCAAWSSLSEQNIQQIDEAVSVLAPSETPAHMPEAFAAVADMVRRAPSQVNTAIYVISDFQRRDWLGASPDAAPGIGTAPADSGVSLLAPLAELSKRRGGLSLALVDVGADSPQNLALTELTPEQAQIAVGVPSRFRLGVANYSTRPHERVEISLRSGEQTLPPLILPRIAAGQVVSEPIELTFSEEGAASIQAAVAGRAAQEDPLSLDNTRYAAARVVGAVQILVVDGEPNSDTYRDEAFLLRTALRPGGRAASGNEVTVVEEHELDGMDSSPYHLVVLANVPRLSPAAEKSLAEFVRSGGGLIVFAGDQVEAAYYNEQLYRRGDGILPALLGEVIEPPAASGGVSLGWWDSTHPILRAFSGDLESVLRQVRINAYQSLRVPDSPPTTTTTGPQGEAPAASAVLARFSDAAQSPAIVARRIGRGWVIVFATSADQEWTDWPSSFSYVPLMLETAQFAARAADAPYSVLVGAPLQCDFEAADYKPDVLLQSPQYPAEPAIPVTAMPARPGVLTASYASPMRAGIWQFDLTRSSGAPVARCAAVNVDPGESDLARASRAQLEGALTEMRFQYVRQAAELATASMSSKTELWWPILLVAAMVLMLEQILAWRFGKAR